MKTTFHRRYRDWRFMPNIGPVLVYRETKHDDGGWRAQDIIGFAFRPFICGFGMVRYASGEPPFRGHWCKWVRATEYRYGGDFHFGIFFTFGWFWSYRS